jgi:UDP-N-acetylmuramoyl-tripeptide--D-alanyl-D-alanine ligase
MTLGHLFGKHVSIDTRTLQPGDIFFAIKGEVDDGHAYVEKAFAKGASAAVVKKGFVVPESLAKQAFYLVEDTIFALHDFAKKHMSQMPAQVVTLTGSSGKTTTKEFIRCALAACLGDDAVIANVGNYNNFVGAPLSMLKVEKHHKAAIFEIGMSQFGEIATLTRLVMPKVALITNIGTAHSGNLGGPDGVAKAKSELFENLDKDAIAVVNVDDPRCVREAAAKVQCRRINFGKAQWADVRLKECESVGPNALHVVCSYQNHDVSIDVPMPGLHNAMNVTAALAVAVALGLDFQKAASGIKNIKPIKGRLVHHKLANGATLIDDTYNANPESMEAGLNVLASHQEATRRIAVLGQMAELGTHAMGLHRSIGALLSHKKVNMLFACGPNGVGYAEGAIAEGFDQSKIVWTETNDELVEKLKQVIQAGDAILVKGSRSTRMEKVVDKLLNA